MAQANPYPIRIEEEVMVAIKKSAKENGRSINKEIEYGLKKYLAFCQEENKLNHSS